jgi:predicted phage terminase large subunit-like protein
MLSPSSRQQTLAKLTPEQQAEVLWSWAAWARPEQLPPDGDWSIWLVKAGRGFGKTRLGAEWVRSVAQPGARIALVAPTAADVRDVIIEGESGILAVCPTKERPIYEPSKRRLTWPNGAVATAYSAEEPDRLRGPQHTHAYCDEVAAWAHPEAWDMMLMGLRLGTRPRVVATTTPRMVPLMRTIQASPGLVVTRGKTLDNAANLAPSFLSGLMARYEGTRIGRQELDGEDLDDNPDALWSREVIDACRLREAPELARVVVAIDPAATSNADSDETGIVVAGLGTDGRGYVLADRSGRFKPDAWARRAVEAYHEHRADRIIAEGNQGGEMVAHVLGTVEAGLPLRIVHATRGKLTRAEPIAALYEQGRVSHVGGLPQLEDQLCTWMPGSASPDRLDALVWALTELMLGRGELAFA